MVISVILDIIELDEAVAKTKGQAVKSSTKKNLLSQMNSYEAFCKRYEFDYFPCNTKQLCRYGQFLKDIKGFISAESIGNYISAVRTAHTLLGFDPPQSEDKQMKLFVNGLRNMLLHDVKQAKAIIPDILLRIYDVVDFTNQTDMVAWVALLIGFYLFLRRSNLVPETMNSFDHTKQFTRRDFHVVDPLKVMMCEIRWSKTIQFKEKVLRLPILPVENKKICPVMWSHYMMNQVPGLPDDPAFLIMVGGQKMSLSANQLIYRFRKWLDLVKEDSTEYSLHSLRRGGATFAQQCNINGNMIQLLGDWASDAWKRYCDVSMDQRFDSMQSFVDGLNKITAEIE